MSLGFKLGDRIGKGSFATVYKGRLNADGGAVAVKVVHRAHLKRDKRLHDNFEAEMAILKQMRHPHIVLLTDVAQTDAEFYLVMEYCSLGDLSYFIRKRHQLCKNLPLIASLYERYPATPAGGLHETVIRHFLCQLAAALKFLRRVDLVHRDIKPQNMLLMPPLDPESARKAGIEGLWELPILKVADFGFARFLPSTSMAETLCGSPLYMAPEILNYEKYNAKADLWSVGAVVYEMTASKPPFPATNHMELIKRINECKDNIAFPPGVDISYDLESLIKGLLKRSPSQRMGFDEFFAHPALEVHGKDKSLDLSALNENMYISEYLQEKTGTPASGSDAAGTTGNDTLDAAASPGEKKYGVDSNPFSSSNESLPNLKTLTTKLSAAAAADDAASASTAATTTLKPKPELGNSMDDYVVVEKRTVEVNALADDLTKREVTPAAFTRRRLSSITYGTSPTNALAQALIKSSARLFGARVDSGTIQIPKNSSVDIPGLANRIRSSPAGSQTFEDKLTHTLDRLNRMSRVVAVFAELKQSQLRPDDDSQDPTLQDIIAQESLSLYLKALGILARAMEMAAQWWAKCEGSTAPTILREVVQSIRDQFNDCIEKAENARKYILNGQFENISAPLDSPEKLLFERALDLARSAASQELSEDLTSCEMNYATALWMLRAIAETEVPDSLSTDDTELVDRLSTRIQQRILALRRRIEGSTLQTSPSRTP